MTKNKMAKKTNNYRQGFLIALIIAIVGMLFEWLALGKGAGLPSWPMNLYIGVSFAFILIFIHVFYSDLKIVRWLSRVPASISSIVLFTILTLIMGLTIQNDPDASLFMKYTGLSHVRNSYVFLLSGMFLLTTLGLVIIRRLNSFSYKNIGFALNHLGLWIIVLAGSLGAGDLTRLNIYANKNKPVWYGFTADRKAVEIPFSINLLDFDIKEFPPKIAYIESETMRLPEIHLPENFSLIEEGKKMDISGWEIIVDEFIMYAGKDSSGNYIASADTFSYPVARISAKHKENGSVKSGWISSGGMKKQPVFLNLDENYALAMTRPEPKEYSSRMEITNAKGEVDTTIIAVNNPLKIDGWSLYQLSYDEKMGKWSTLSVIEAIRDPWLPIIYLGIFMVLAGAIYLFTIGKNPKEDKE
jgi:hypothetical protein